MRSHRPAWLDSFCPSRHWRNDQASGDAGHLPPRLQPKSKSIGRPSTLFFVLSSMWCIMDIHHSIRLNRNHMKNASCFQLDLAVSLLLPILLCCCLVVLLDSYSLPPISMNHCLPILPACVVGIAQMFAGPQSNYISWINLWNHVELSLHGWLTWQLELRGCCFSFLGLRLVFVFVLECILYKRNISCTVNYKLFF